MSRVSLSDIARLNFLATHENVHGHPDPKTCPKCVEKMKEIKPNIVPRRILLGVLAGLLLAACRHTAPPGYNTCSYVLADADAGVYLVDCK